MNILSLRRLSPLALLLSSAQVTGAPLMPKAMEKDLRKDAVHQVSRAAEAINRAAVAHQKQGADAFFKALPAQVNTENRRHLMRELGKIQKLPLFEMRGEKLALHATPGRTLIMDSFDVAQGIFKVDGQVYFYNDREQLFENMDRWQKQAKGSGALYKLYDLFVPQAEAKAPSGLVFAGIAILGWLIGTTLIPKVKAWMNPAPENQMPAPGHGPYSGYGSMAGSNPYNSAPGVTPTQAPTGPADPGSQPAPQQPSAAISIDDYKKVLCNETGVSDDAKNLLKAVVYYKSEAFEQITPTRRAEIQADSKKELVDGLPAKTIFSQFATLDKEECITEKSTCKSAKVTLRNGDIILVEADKAFDGNSPDGPIASVVKLIKKGAPGTPQVLCPATI